ncbi:DNA ligase D [Geotalea sp. SG265]|uniref:DNA ligase D n=1 Tax=Geotalea sp. SG265 TaxID=2922867 RepID=UPI001FAE82F4|nr:DNA ligase D [Geotalea sp. SG265]
MPLEDYRRKRDFERTPEPPPRAGSLGAALRFVVQKHAASHLHYDLRLELDGALKSWAVPKGPSLDPSVKRLAMMVEDHPFDYRTFEGIIPPGSYGAGSVIIWDEGTCHAYETEDRRRSEDFFRKGLDKGNLKFVLNGHKLKGRFALVRIKSAEDNSWLLVKKEDEFAGRADITIQDRSVVSGRRVEELGPEGEEPVMADLPGDPAPMPHNIRPMLATLVKDPFDNPDWIFEIKLDGYRTIAEISSGTVRLYSRNLLSFNTRFPTIAAPLAGLGREAILDGEVVAMDENGRSDFQLLQNYGRTGEGLIIYFVFDLLYLDGHDLRNLPLLTRKTLLQEILPDLMEVKYCDHMEETGIAFFQAIEEKGLEGIVAKRVESRYETGRRSSSWLKIKATLRQEAIICGFTAPRRSRKKFGTLALGAYDNGELVYIGTSGGGFNEESLHELYDLLQPLIQQDCPFKGGAATRMPAQWVRPQLVCEVSFSEWTGDGIMRQPVFLGLRPDKEPATVTRETFPGMVAAPPPPAVKGVTAENELIVGGRRLRLSNLDKLFWPEQGYTKREVIDYYRTVARHMLPHLRDRPQSLYRTPNGIAETGFFQKDVKDMVGDWPPTEAIYSESQHKTITFLICQDEASLIYLANLGCIEINPWLSRLGSLDNPDYLVIDLDPEEIGFDKVVEAALAVKEVLDRAGAASFPKTSGATGMHIYVPLGARYDYETAGRFAHLIATLANQLVPGFTSLERSPAKRQRKVYLDFLQNKRGQTLAAPYSIRPRPGATVSTPLTWDEVRPGLDPRDFTLKTAPQRLDRIGDIFAGTLGPGINMEQCIERLEND